MLIPKLRFENFSDEWKTYLLQDLVEFKNGLNKEKEAFGKGTPIINYMDVNKNENITNNLVKGKVTLSNKEISNFNVKKGDIFFTRTSETSEEIGMASSLIENVENGVFSGFVLRARPKGNFFYDKYPGYYFRTRKMREEIIKHSSITTRALTSGSLLNNLSVNIPSVQEQTKIADFLSLIDKKIQLQQEKIEKFELYKKSIIYNVFNNDNYKSKKLKFRDILFEVSCKTDTKNQYPILSSTIKGIFLQEKYFNKQAASENNIGYKIIKEDQLVFSPQNLWMGNININRDINVGMVSPSYRIFDINNINNHYLEAFIHTKQALHEYNISSEQGASIVRKNLNLELFLEITIKVPEDLLIEKKLGNVFKLINEKIKLEKEKLHSLIELKQGFMQQMFV